MIKSVKGAISVISIAVLINLLTGCGGTSSSSSSSSSTAQSTFKVNGVVSDGAISDAMVWLDLNDNGSVDAGEPSTRSDNQGNFIIETIQSIDLNVFIRAMGGVDTNTGLDFEGVLEALSQTDTEDLTQMLTPLTTLEAKGMVEEEIRAMFPDLPEGDIDKMNPNENEIVERIGVVVHSTIAQLTQATKEERTDAAIADVYKDFAEKFKGNQLSFDKLPIEEIMQESTAAIDSVKATTIKSMIMETTRGMFELDVAAEDYDTKMKELQTFAIKDINIDLDNFMKSSMSKEDFMGVTKLVRDGIISKKIDDVSGQITEDMTDQVMQDNAVQIQNIREQIESDIKADLDFESQVEGIDSEVVDVVEQQVETQVQNEIREQIEQSITEQIQNNINTNFVDLNSNGGNVNNQAIQDMTNSIKDQIASQFGSNFGGFFGGFPSRSKVK